MARLGFEPRQSMSPSPAPEMQPSPSLTSCGDLAVDAFLEELAVKADEKAELDSKISRLEAKLAEFEARVSRIDEMEARISQLEAENLSLREMVGTSAKNPILRKLENVKEARVSGSREMDPGGSSEREEEVEIGEKDQILSKFELGSDGIDKEARILGAMETGNCSEREAGVEIGEKDAIVDTLEVSSDAIVKETGVLRATELGSCLRKEGGVKIGLKDPILHKLEESYKGGAGGGKSISIAKSIARNEEGEAGVLQILTPNKKRTLQLVTSDSENEDGDKDDCNVKEERITKKLSVRDEETVCPVPTPRRKRASRVVASDSESEDDMILIGELLKKRRQGKVIEKVKEFSGEREKDAWPPRTRLSRLRRGDSKSSTPEESCHKESLTKDQLKRRPAAYRKLNYADSEEDEEDGESEGDSLGGFIVNEHDSPENASSSDQSSSCGSKGANSDVDYQVVLAGIGRKSNTKSWEYEADMLSALAKNPELCLKAVCALYRQQTSEEQSAKATFMHNKRGFSQIDAPRGSFIAEFLLDGDPYGPLKKTVQELEEYDCYGLEFCDKLAKRYSKQLFAIYQNKEDPYFHP